MGSDPGEVRLVGGIEVVHRVLIVAPEQELRTRAAGILARAGLQTFERPSPLGATSLLVRENIDLLVIDANAREVMTAGRFLDLLHKAGALGVLPVLLLGESSDPAVLELQAEHETIESIPLPRLTADLARRALALLGVPSHEQRAPTVPPKPPAARGTHVLRFQGHAIRLPVGTFRIGRAIECDCQLDSTSVSRVHAAIHVSAGGDVEIEDLGSRNGTLVNGEPLRGRAPLGRDDTFTIGGTVMRVQPARKRDRTTHAESAPPPRPAPRDATSVTQGWSFADGLVDQAAQYLEEGDLKGARATVANLYMWLYAAFMRNEPPEASVVSEAVEQALALAEQTRSGEWVDRIVELHSVARRPFDDGAVTRLRALADRGVRPSKGRVATYLRSLASERTQSGQRSTAFLGWLAVLGVDDADEPARTG